MKLTNSIENMKGQLMSVLNSDDGYKRITGLIDEINKIIDNAEVKDKLDIARRYANVAIIRSFIGKVIELNRVGITPDSFNEYKDCFEKLEEACAQELIDLEDKK